MRLIPVTDPAAICGRWTPAPGHTVAGVLIARRGYAHLYEPAGEGEWVDGRGVVLDPDWIGEAHPGYVVEVDTDD